MRRIAFCKRDEQYRHCSAAGSGRLAVMFLRLQIVLIWMLALPLPMQAMAATGHIQCVSPQPSHVSHLTITPTRALADNHLHRLHAHTQAHADETLSSQHKQTCARCLSCDVCNTCPYGSILPTMANSPLLAAAINLHAAIAPPEYVSHIADHPERPPSALL